MLHWVTADHTFLNWSSHRHQLSLRGRSGSGIEPSPVDYIIQLWSSMATSTLGDQPRMESKSFNNRIKISYMYITSIH